MGKRIIVTGGSGFLGTHLLRALVAEGYEVKNIDLRQSKEFDTVVADVQDKERMLVEITDAEAVFHLASLIEAGESVKEPQKFIDYNIDGTLSVLDAMKANGISTFLFSSSAAVYGEPIRVPIQEDDRTMPINPYGMTKLAMEALLSSYVQAHGFTGVALRY
ncbi:UDP-glucose 4-epimerase, partial [Candidatus Woesebacteria bacterium]|nr:UDP-glucose 4-epimerase [Candidatus Woesebacteria bacterium]